MLPYFHLLSLSFYLSVLLNDWAGVTRRLVIIHPFRTLDCIYYTPCILAYWYPARELNPATPQNIKRFDNSAATEGYTVWREVIGGRIPYYLFYLLQFRRSTRLNGAFSFSFSFFAIPNRLLRTCGLSARHLFILGHVSSSVLNDVIASSLAPDVGLEPTTLRLWR